jgi:hypothetical protein
MPSKVYMKCTHKSSIFIYALSFDGFWQEKYITPNVTFWRSHDIVNTKNGIFLSWLLIFSYACNNSLFNVCVCTLSHFICTVLHILLLFVERLKIQWNNTWQIPYHPIVRDPLGQCLVFVSFKKVGTWIFKSMPYKHLFGHKHKPKKI